MVEGGVSVCVCVPEPGVGDKATHRRPSWHHVLRYAGVLGHALAVSLSHNTRCWDLTGHSSAAVKVLIVTSLA